MTAADLSHLLEHRRFLLEAHEERPAEANREEYLDFHYAGQPRSPESSKQAEASYQGVSLVLPCLHPILMRLSQFCLHGEPALGSEEYPVYDPSNPTGAQRQSPLSFLRSQQTLNSLFAGSSSNVRTSSDEGAARAPVASGSGLARNATGVIYLSDSDSENCMCISFLPPSSSRPSSPMLIDAIIQRRPVHPARQSRRSIRLLRPIDRFCPPTLPSPPRPFRALSGGVHATGPSSHPRRP